MNFTSVMTWLNPDVARQIATALVHSTWQGMAGAFMLVGLLRMMKNRSANSRYVVSCAMLVVIFAATVGTFVISAPHQHILPAIHPTEFVGPAAVTDASRDMTAGKRIMSPSMGNFAVTAWIVGVALLSLWQVGGWCWLQMIRRHGTPTGMQQMMDALAKRVGVSRLVRMIETARVDAPAVVGVWRPVVLIPVGFMTGLAPQQIQAILAHELAHIRRWDYLANLLQSVIETLLFYHPAVWWISAQIRQERENCCDDIAAGIAGDCVAYAEMLVMLEGRRAPMMAIAAGGGALSKRVRRLIGAPAPRRSRTRSAVAGILASACVIAVVLNRLAPAQTEKVVKAVVAATTNISSSILPEDLVAEPHDYQIGPNDLVSVAINDLVGPGVETTKSARVGEKSGEISMPLVGYIHIAGLTAPQAEKAISDAYKKAALIQNAQVSVQVAEQRGNTFSALGAVGRPGEYAIPKSDFRLLDALVLAGGQSGQTGKLTILRKQSGAAPRRIDVPIVPLIDGDPQYNVVIHPGDMITMAEPEKRFLRVILDRDAMFMRDAGRGWAADRKVDWNHVEDFVRALTPPERHATVLEIGVASRDLPVGTFLDGQAAGSELVKKYSMMYLSDVGVQPVKKSEAPADRVYYIGGHVQRVGVYQLAPNVLVSVKAAIIAAGMQDQQGKFVEVFRRSEKGSSVALNATIDPQLSDPKLDMLIEPNDQIMINDKPPNEK